MKNILIIFSVLISFNSYAQKQDIPFNKSDISIDETTRKITFLEIDSLPGITQDVIFSKALEWIALNFRDANSVIKLQDRVGGKIVVKGWSKEIYNLRIMGQDFPTLYNQWFTINITCRENKYRVVFTDYYIESTARVIGAVYIPSQETPVEEYLKSIPDQYVFKNLKKKDKTLMVVSKQILNNVVNESRKDISALKSFIRRNNIKSVDQNAKF
jgi:hypothetical protein